MKKIESDCLQCPDDLGCIGSACPYYRHETHYCDLCNERIATYRIDNNDVCEECASEYLQYEFDDLTTKQKAKALNINMGDIGQDDIL